MTKSDVPFDPSKPLRNRKHEKLAQELAKRPQDSQSEIYKEIYPKVSEEASIPAASRLLSNVNIRERVLSLLSKSANRPILEKVSDKVNEHIDGENAPVSMDACKTVLKIAGALDDQRQAETSYNPTAIIINIVTPKTQHTDTTEVTPNDK